jgi:hypothetical protein
MTVEIPKVDGSGSQDESREAAPLPAWALGTGGESPAVSVDGPVGGPVDSTTHANVALAIPVADLRAAAAEVAQQEYVRGALLRELPARNLLFREEDTVAYECDGLTAYRQRPMIVALPETDEQVAAVLRVCHNLRVPIVARGAGTGLSGGALPHKAGVTLSLARLNRILQIDPLRMRCAQPGDQ